MRWKNRKISGASGNLLKINSTFFGGAEKDVLAILGTITMTKPYLVLNTNSIEFLCATHWPLV